MLKPHFFIFIALILALNIPAAPVFAENTSMQKKMEQIENQYQKKIGVAAVNLGNQQSIGYRAEEFFPIQSTFKTFLVAFILKQSMDRAGLLKQELKINKADIVAWSPITEKNAGKKMSIDSLCQAAISYSDNTATNLLLNYAGGPEALTLFMRSTGDHTFRIDGWEPALNSDPDKQEDSSTPASIKNSLVKILKTNLLGQAEKQKLLHWMKNNTTGNHRIRSGIDKGWVVADKTGAGAYGIANDIAIIWPPNCEPIVLAIYTHGKQKQEQHNEQVFTEITRSLMNHFAKTDPCLLQNSNQSPP